MMLKKILKLIGRGIRGAEQQTNFPKNYTPIAEYNTVIDEGVKLEDRLSNVILAWEKRTGNKFKDILEGGTTPGEWGLPLLHNGALFFGSREYEAYRTTGTKQDNITKEVMCLRLQIEGMDVVYHINDKCYTKKFGTIEEANFFAIRVLAARKSSYNPPEEKL